MDFKESLEYVVKNRIRNLSAEIPVLNDQSLLADYHPNYKKQSFKMLDFGANKGDYLPTELADALKYNPKAEIFDLPHYETDVLIIGGGGAGAAAAIEAKKNGAKVILATKFRFGDSNTAIAKGGISAAISDADSPEIYFDDSFSGGHQKANQKLLKILCDKGRQSIEWLQNLGVNFDKTRDGKLIVNAVGGATKKRLLSVKDHTGLEIIKALKSKVLSDNITVLENHTAISLVLENERVTGAIFTSPDKVEQIYIKAAAVVLATGGVGSLKCGGFPTSNCHGITGDGLSLAYNVGAKLINAESLQYHPTGAAFPDKLLGKLVTEKARSLGARLINATGECFVNSMSSRDTVTAAIIKECESGRGVKTEKGVGVWLDIPMIDLIMGDGTVKSDLPSLYKMFKAEGVDITTEPILVYPTLHYQNGGLQIDEHCQTTVKNLFAAGEVAGGIHGENRLMGNSLLDIIVFGRIAGENAAKISKKI